MRSSPTPAPACGRCRCSPTACSQPCAPGPERAAARPRADRRARGRWARSRASTMIGWRDMAGDNVVIVGFMGAGKSVCGRLLARRLGRCFVETDDMIVSRDGRAIPDIFRAEGEEAFRRLEGELLGALALKSGDVIAAR